MANLIIHRGTHQIGGNAVEVNSNNTKLLFDFGVPLESMEKEKWSAEEYKLPIKGLYKNEEPEFDAVFLTHAHPDHYGLMQLINTEIPIYVSKITYDILTKVIQILPKQNTKNLNLHIIDNDIEFKNIKVKAHTVNHSIAGACAYEIITDEKTIVYSGDLRFHGRSSWKSYLLAKKIKNPDYLIMEGTTLGRPEQNIIKEKNLEKNFIQIFKTGRLPIVQFSPLNIDRLVTIYRACIRTGKTLVIDPYTAFVLEVCSPLSKNIPQFDWDNIMVNFASRGINDKLRKEKILYRYKTKKIKLEEIVTHPERYVIKGNWSINQQIFDAIEHDKIEIVYSMWKGYLDRPNQFDNYKDIKLTPIHTSGHAYLEDLQKFVEKMQPENLIPIHTECNDKYQELFKANVILLNDGQTFDL